MKTLCRSVTDNRWQLVATTLLLLFSTAATAEKPKTATQAAPAPRWHSRIQSGAALTQRNFEEQLQQQLLFLGAELESAERSLLLRGLFELRRYASEEDLERQLRWRGLTRESLADGDRSADVPVGSLAIESPWLSIHAGERFLPGSGGSFMRHPILFSGFGRRPPALPTPLRQPTLFVQPLPIWLLPGPFWIRGETKPGIFVADPAGRLFLGHHPESGESALSLAIGHGRSRRIEGGAENRLWIDLERRYYTIGYSEPQPEPEPIERPSASGYLRLQRRSIVFEAERRVSWDFIDGDLSQQPYEGRWGRSGLLHLNYLVLSEERQWRRFDFGLTAAGIDRALDGFRTGDLALYWPAGPGWFLPLRLRYYERRHYQQSGSEPRWHDRSLAGGVGYRHGGGSVALWYESPRSGPQSMELQLGLRAGGEWQISIGALGMLRSRQSSAPETLESGFLVLRGPVEDQASVRFYEEGSGALLFRLQSRHIYFYSSLTYDPLRRRSYGSASLQFRAIW